MSKSKEVEIVTTSEHVKQNSKAKAKPHIADVSSQFMSPLDINLKSESKVCINSPTPEDASKKKVIEVSKKTAVQEDGIDQQKDKQLNENKGSAENKPFRILEPEQEPIVEQPIAEKVTRPEDEKEEKPPDVSEHSPQAEPPPVSKTLAITVLESPTLKQGTVLKMTHTGLEGSKRDEKDGRAYFGTDTGQGQHQTNDCVFSMDEQGFGRRHFVIEYEASRNVYMLKDLGDGTGTFIRVVEKRSIKKNVILSFTTLHLAVLFPNKQDHDALDPSLKEISKDDITDPKTYFMYFNSLGSLLKYLMSREENFSKISTNHSTFTPADSPITIGRGNSATISIPKKGLSRVQCTYCCITSRICYEELNWTLHDGDGVKQSTNGTWIFVEDAYELVNGLVFKAGQTMFKVNVDSTESHN